MDVENKVGLDGWWNVKIKRMIFILFLIVLNWGVKKMSYCMCIKKKLCGNFYLILCFLLILFICIVYFICN